MNGQNKIYQNEVQMIFKEGKGHEYNQRGKKRLHWMVFKNLKCYVLSSSKQKGLQILYTSQNPKINKGLKFPQVEHTCFSCLA